MTSTDALASILLDRQLLAANDLERCLEQAAAGKRYLEEVLVREGLFSRAQLLEILENHYYCPAIDLGELPFDPTLLALLPRKVAAQHLALPVGVEGEKIKVAMANPEDIRAQDAIGATMRRQIIRHVALRDELKSSIDSHYGRLNSEVETADTAARAPLPGAPSPAPSPRVKAAAKKLQLDLRGKTAVAVVDECLEAAARYRASDIHMQPHEDELAVRLRIDGILYTVARLPKELTAQVISRVKVLGNMDVAERRVPQDGRHTLRKGDLLLDLRISSLPAQFGEKIVIRILTKNAALMNLENLKMPHAIRKAYQEVIDNPQGFYLVTGPTGSGKSTTLHATLNAIDREVVNVVTLEDPIEYQLPQITQVQINEDAGMTFASGLRSILRQDPDVILVGEVRDRETVEIACRAALTGHKVFSTIHANDTCQVVTRLIDMGTAPYLITATLKGVLSQRLVRTLCERCKVTYQATETELAILGYPKIEKLHRGKGCVHCSETGYRGRMALYEYLRIEDNLHRLIIDRASPYTIRHAAQRNGMVLMADFAKRAVLEGITTVAEIQRAVLADEAKEQLCHNCQRVVNLDFAVCPFCQHILKEKCHSCGSPVEAGWEACPNCGDEIEREWKKVHCRHCLAPVDPHLGSCPYCGGGLP